MNDPRLIDRNGRFVGHPVMSKRTRLIGCAHTAFWASLVIFILSVSAVFILGADFDGMQIESEENVQSMWNLLPTLSDPSADVRLHDERIIWYTTETMGITYQAHSGSSPGRGPIGFADATTGRPNQNTRERFPWGPFPGGTHRATNNDSFKGLLLPSDEDGEPLPVVWYRHKLEGLKSPNETVRGWNWTFPTGTVIWEILTVNHQDQSYVYEVRSRWRYADHWLPRVYRPFPTSDDIADVLVNRPRTELGAAFIDFARRPVVSTATIVSTETGNPVFGTNAGDAFNMSFGIDELPPLDASLVALLLDTTAFREIDGTQWKPGASSPVSSHDFHIIPNRSLLPIVGGDEVTCSRCHDSSLTSSRRFGKNAERWGWVRGNLGRQNEGGGILSWHPVRPSVFRGRLSANPNVEMRKKWVDGGIIERFSRERHSRKDYRRLVPKHLEN